MTNPARFLVSIGGVAAVAMLLSGRPVTAAPGPTPVVVVNPASTPVPTVQAGPVTVDVASAPLLAVKPQLGAPFADVCFFTATRHPDSTTFSGRCTFPRLPAGKRLVIDYVSAEATATGDDTEVSFSFAPRYVAYDPPNLYLPFYIVPVRIGARSFVGAQALELHLDPEGPDGGDRLSVAVLGESTTPPPFARFSIAGRLFDR